MILEPAVQRSPPTTSRKFGETDRVGNTTGEAGLVEQWLNKIERAMKVSLRDHMRTTLEDYSKESKKYWDFC